MDIVVGDDDAYLAHYGVLRRSGRYPWGSGGPEYASNKGFLGYVNELKAKGFSEPQIAEAMGTSTTQLRAAKTIAKAEEKAANAAMALRLQEKGWSNGKIAERLGLAGESTVRSLTAPGALAKADQLLKISEMLKREVEEKKFLDIGAGTENYVGVSKDRLNVAVAILKEDGYEVHTVKIQQVGTGFDTEYKVLCPPGTTQKDVFLNRLDIRQITEFSDDMGASFGKTGPPMSIHPKRVQVKWDEDGGGQADGVIYVRPGVPDVSLGGGRYAQVRIKVGENHYLKGMAVYKDDLPPGTDLVFHTNKTKQASKLDAMKPIKRDKEGKEAELPFGSVTRQVLGPDGKNTSVMNIVGTKDKSNDEGAWDMWGRNLSAQMLSKQSPTLAQRQLDITYARRKAEFDEIMSITNPVVKEKLLKDFSEGTDAAAVHLKAAALPRSSWHVILPIASIKPTEVYAPSFKDGERVVLIRYPHGGTFEIPELTVNNRNREARKVIGTDTKDAIGIHHKTAEHLSGADFDGDAVLVIPNAGNKVKVTPALTKLKDFDPRTAYPAYEGMPEMKSKTKQMEMGNVSNLITDMTLGGAPHTEIARAVRHSMVVIDAEKHNLNWRQSEKDNGIRALKERYQGINPKTGRARGASTIISRAGSEARVPERKLRPMREGGPIDPKTGKLVHVPTGRQVPGKGGVLTPRLEKVKKLAIEDDARALLSDAATPIERKYADHSNRLKALANEARLASLKIPPTPWNPSAKKVYAEEVASLENKLSLAQKNKPVERRAQILANQIVRAKRHSNPDLTPDQIKKVKYQALDEARARTQAAKKLIIPTDKEWEAIQAGAISASRLREILTTADMDRIRALATPQVKVLMTTSKTSQARALLASGKTRAEVAALLGVSLSTLDASTSDGQGGE